MRGEGERIQDFDLVSTEGNPLGSSETKVIPTSHSHLLGVEIVQTLKHLAYGYISHQPRFRGSNDVTEMILYETSESASFT